MSSYKIAKEIGVTRQAVDKWIHGKSTPGGANLIALAAYLKVTPGKVIQTLKKMKPKR